MCQSVPSIKDERIGQIVDWTRWISQVLVIPLLIIMGYAWLNHEEKIDAMGLVNASIVSNRFTSADGLEVWREIARQQAEIATLSSRQAVHHELSAGWIDIIREHERRLGKLEN